MSSIHIPNTHRQISFDDFKNLMVFAQRKQAKEWCVDNNVKPARIVKLETRMQESYALDMGHDCFLTDEKYIAAFEANIQ